MMGREMMGSTGNDGLSGSAGRRDAALLRPGIRDSVCECRARRAADGSWEEWQ